MNLATTLDGDREERRKVPPVVAVVSSETLVLGSQRSKPSNRRSISSTVEIDTPDSHTFPKMSSRVTGSRP